MAGDSLNASYTSASFADKHVGAGKPVSVSGISLSGVDAGNYQASTTASTTADITARVLTVSAAGAGPAAALGPQVAATGTVLTVTLVIEADEPLLRQALFNLLLNAVVKGTVQLVASSLVLIAISGQLTLLCLIGLASLKLR